MDAYTKHKVKQLQDRLAVLNIRLGYAKNRREIEREQIEAEMKEIEEALDFLVPDRAAAPLPPFSAKSGCEVTKQKILAAFEDCYNDLHDLSARSGFSKTTVRKHLKQLLEEKVIQRIDISVSRTPNWVYVTRETGERIKKEMHRIYR